MVVRLTIPPPCRAGATGPGRAAGESGRSRVQQRAAGAASQGIGISSFCRQTLPSLSARVRSTAPIRSASSAILPPAPAPAGCRHHRSAEGARRQLGFFALTGQVAIVTGSTKGIAKAITSRMAEAGAKIVVSSRKAEVFDAVAAEINEKWAKNGGEAVAVPCPVSHKDQLKTLVDHNQQKGGQHGRADRRERTSAKR